MNENDSPTQDGKLRDYFTQLHSCLDNTAVTLSDGEAATPDQGVARTVETARACVTGGNKLIFIGNGGSAGICSHMATDYSKNGALSALAFNDGAMLTCLGNDYGYAHVFAKQIEFQGKSGDLLFAISSSGKSENILNAVNAARKAGLSVITLSGFDETNPLRGLGDVNFYVSSHEYGFVEISHLTLCHAILDLHMGWGK